MSDTSPIESEKKGTFDHAKDDVDIEAVPVYDDDGPVEFAEKAELRLVQPMAS